MEGVEAIGGGQEGQGPVDCGRMDRVTEQRNRSAHRAFEQHIIAYAMVIVVAQDNNAGKAPKQLTRQT